MKAISQLVWEHWKGWLLREALQEIVACFETGSHWLAWNLLYRPGWSRT